MEYLTAGLAGYAIHLFCGKLAGVAGIEPPNAAIIKFAIAHDVLSEVETAVGYVVAVPDKKRA